MLIPRIAKILAGCFGITIFGIIVGWVILPTIMKLQLKRQMALSKKTDLRQMWSNLPFALGFKIYVFNYTNADEISKGATPIVKEIGPYYFEEWKEKVELKDNEEEDTVSYKRRDTFFFRPDLSGPGLTGEEVVTIPHVFVLAMAITVNREKPAMLNMVGKAMNGVFDNPPDVFLRAKVLDIFFRGTIIDCAKTEFAPKSACAAIKKAQINGMTYEPNNQFRFSLFGSRNNSIDQRVITVKRGKRNVKDVGQVIAVNGEPEQKMWKDHCNQYNGNDGTVFSPFLTKDDIVKSYFIDLCRSFDAWFIKKTKYKGIPTNRFYVNIGDLANDPKLQCYCDSPETCPPKGLMDLTNCIKAPMYLSLPHFLDSDPKLLQGIRGLNPDIDQHAIVIDFEMLSGTPMSAKQRVQFNIELFNTDKIEIFKDLPGSIAPIFWIEEGLTLNKTYVNMLKYQLIFPKKFVKMLSWFMIFGGIVGAVIGTIFHFRGSLLKSNKDDNKITKVNPEENGEKDISVIGTQEPPKINM